MQCGHVGIWGCAHIRFADQPIHKNPELSHPNDVSVCVRLLCVRNWDNSHFKGNEEKKDPGPLHRMTIICPTLMGFLIDDSDSAVVPGDSVFWHGKENTPSPVKCTNTPSLIFHTWFPLQQWKKVQSRSTQQQEKWNKNLTHEVSHGSRLKQKWNLQVILCESSLNDL